MLFIQEKNLSTTEANLYFGFRPKKEAEAESTNKETNFTPEIETKKNDKLIFHFDYVTGI